MRLLVVGGGITGLAAAWQAVHPAVGQERAEVVLVEASDRFGGKVRTEHTDGLLIEHGPDSFVAYRPAALKLIEELGLSEEVISISGTRTVSLRSRGRLRPLPAGMGMVLPTKLWPFVTTGILTPGDKLRAGLDLLLPRRLREGQDVTIGSFLRSRLGPGIVQRFADPMVGGIYGASVNELSLDAVLGSLRSDEATYRSLMLASLAAGRRARGNSRGPGSPFRTVRGGLAEMVDALVSQLRAEGAELRSQVRLTSLRPTTTGGATATFSAGETEHFDAVVLAGGVTASAQLLTDASTTAAQALGEIPLATSTVVNLAYPAAAFPTPVTSHGWLEADPAPISGVTISSAKWAGRAPTDTVLIRAFVPGRLGAIAEAPDSELTAAVTDHLASVMGVVGAPTTVRISRWPQVMPKYTLGHLDRVARVDAGLADLPRWRVAGSALRGVGVPDCIADGRRQTELALGQGAQPDVRVES